MVKFYIYEFEGALDESQLGVHGQQALDYEQSGLEVTQLSHWC